MKIQIALYAALSSVLALSLCTAPAPTGDWSVIMIADGEAWAVDTGLTAEDCQRNLGDWDRGTPNVTFICEEAP